MATPTEWLSEFKVNTGTADNASAQDAQILGLSNGNFLVAWAEFGTTGVGTQAGYDIIGKIYDGEGNVVRDSYRINSTRSADDERDFDIGATNDGGFVLVYVDNDGSDSRVVWERKDAAGNNTHSLDVISETGTNGDFDNPRVAVSNTTNNSYITFTDYDPGGLLNPADDDISGIVVSPTGTITTAKFEAAQDGGFPSDADNQVQNAVAINDGTSFEIVSAYRDSTDNTVRVDVYSTGGTLRHTAVVDDTGTPHEPSVATLSNGNIVVAWEDDSDDVNYRVYNENLGVVLGKTSIDNTDADEVEVIALPNGEFVIIWDNNTGTNDRIQGQKYNSNGTTDGSVFTIETANAGAPEISVTGDGRVLFTWTAGGDVWASIWDPRDGSIFASTYDDPDRQFVDGDTIYGSNGNDTIVGDNGTADRIYGLDGNDLITGNDDNDTIFGGADNDTITGSGGNDSIEGGLGDDLIRMFNNDGLDIIDGGGGDDTVDFTNETSTVQANLLFDFYTIGASISRSLDRIEHVDGGVGDDLITGDDTANKLNGDLGNDILSGRGGNDTLDGQGNTDTADYSYSGPPVGPALISNWTFDLGAGTAVFSNVFNPNIETDTLISIENIRGSDWGDTFIGAGGPNRMEGRGGNDTFVHTSLGSDTLDGGSGTDTLVSDISWSDTVLFDLVAGRVSFGGTNRDTLIDIENVTVGGGADVTGNAQANRIEALDTGFSHNNTFEGGDGDDTLIGGIGDDSLVGGNNNDTFIDDLADGLTTIAGGNGVDTLDLSSSAAGFVYTDGAGSFADVLVGGVQRLDTTSIENLIGSDLADDITEGNLNGITAGDGDDTVTGSANGAGDIFDGGEGVDTFIAQGDQSRGYDMATGVVTTGSGAQVLNFENLTLQAGNDTVTGNDADNVIRTGNGDNLVNGSLGNDEVFGGDGADTLEGGGGADTLRGGAGIDSLIGGTEDDVYYVNDAADVTVELAGEGIDLVNSWSNYALRDHSQHTENLTLLGTGNINGTGNGLANVIRGNSGDNVLDGAFGGDTIIAGEGNDTVIGGDGPDRVELDQGADVFNDSAQVGPLGNDTVFGGIGEDTINGGGGDDEFHGQDGNDSMTGGIGNDLLFGGTGFDTIQAGEGDDTVRGGDGRDLVELNEGNDIFFDTSQGGVNGQDTVFGGIGNDTINGGAGNDEFHGNDDNDLIFGALGDDTLFGGTGDDTLNAGDGADVVYGGDGRDRANLGIGDDIFYDTAQGGVNGQDTVFAGDGADTIEGGAGNDSFFGDAGNDLIFGRFGNDSIYGGDNFDTIYAGDNDDLVFGGNGRDEIFLGNGADTYIDTAQGGVNGQDTITGGAGADTFVFNAVTSADVITDFAKGVDTLRLDDALWGGGLTAQQVVNTYATDTGPDVLFDFGGGNTILLQGVNNLTNLASDLDIV